MILNLNKNKKTFFTLLPTVLALAWPTMLEELMQTAVQYIDTAMVGVLGTNETAAVGATATLAWLIGGIVSAVGVGFLAYISQNEGAGNRDKVKRAAAQSVFVVIILGTILTAITLSLARFIPAWMQAEEEIRPLASRYFFILYTPMIARTAIIIFGTQLRAVGDSKTPMLVGLCVNLTNIILNFFLIYPSRVLKLFGFEIFMPGAGFGVEGAALASAIAFFLGGCIITVAFLKHNILSPKGYSFKPDKEILTPCFKVALPNLGQRFATSLGYVAFAAMINSLGEVSAAAHTIANTVESAFYIPGYGMQAAASTLTGNAIGMGDKKRLRDLGRVMLTFEVLLMIVSGGLLFAFAPSMMSLFSNDPLVIEKGVTVLRMVALSEPFYGVSIIIEGMLMGMGRTVMPFICNVTGMWAVRIGGTFICINLFSLGLISAWSCMIVHNMLLFLLYTMYYIKLNKRG